jgi:putative ABC transport system permease protein
LEVVDGKLILLSFGLLLMLTAFAGAYPAYFVSRFQTIGALKGNDHIMVKRQGMRKALVVFQLAIACMLLSGSLFIIRQLNYLQYRPLGYQKEHIINIPLQSQNLNGFFQQNDSVFNQKIKTFQDKLLQQTGVKQTTLSSGSPGGGAVYRGTIPEGYAAEDMIFAANLSIDYNFLQAFNIELVAGRNFSKEYGSDIQSAFLINETAVKEFNWKTPEAALGKTIDREGKKGVVVGVVKDFNFSSLTTPISALILSMDTYAYNTLSIKFENADIKSKIKNISDEWNLVFPEKAFEFTFLDDQLREQYESFTNFGLIIQSFTGIAMLIACLGVYGLVLFTVQRKTKEIGVRKVLGASVGSVLKLIIKDFAILIFLGFVIAIPVSYYFINTWLDNFVYRTPISGLIYWVSLAIITLIVGLTIGYQSIRAAQTDPIKSLRME